LKKRFTRRKKDNVKNKAGSEYKRKYERNTKCIYVLKIEIKLSEAERNKIVKDRKYESRYM